MKKRYTKKLTHKEIVKICADVRQRCNKLSPEERMRLLKMGMEIINGLKI